MKNTALVTIFLLLLTGCFGPNTLDTTSQETIKSSAQSITADMTEQEQAEFAKARFSQANIAEANFTKAKYY